MMDVRRMYDITGHYNYHETVALSIISTYVTCLGMFLLLTSCNKFAGTLVEAQNTKFDQNRVKWKNKWPKDDEYFMREKIV
jgi:hypothetical protein